MNHPDQPGAGDSRLEAWERRTAWPLIALSVVFLFVYAVPILKPDMSSLQRNVSECIVVGVWVLFGADLVVRVALSTNRIQFLRGHLFDIAVLVLPMLRPLRLLRLITPVLTLARRTETLARGRLALYVGSTTVLLTMVAGLAVLDAERAAGDDATINSYSEALWWAMVTITTVGYGDHYPVTLSGKLVASALMIGGIGLIGFVTGSLASWIVERISISGQQTQQATRDDITNVLTELSKLRAEVAELRGGEPERADALGAPGGGRSSPDPGIAPSRG
ncbi:MAG: potassium channel family protein [Dactylosporangium sp.]|nr:potassium channel family protein [Dactylosporangium sp.]NNJ62113.1 potassium channel family protein [Dactylosporangium sp.]